MLGFLALRGNHVGREDLLAAFELWLRDPDRPLGEILRRRQTVSAHDLASVEAQVNSPGFWQGLGFDRVAADVATASFEVGELKSAPHSPSDGPASGATHRWHAASTRLSPHAGSPPQDGKTERYQKLASHAKGGLGEVFVAQDLELQRKVALKEIQCDRAHDQVSRTRFVLEAEITGSLEHPGIVPVYGFGHYADGRPFYAMRFISGESLRDAIDHFHSLPSEPRPFHSLPFRALLNRFVAVCNAIEYAHGRGVLHRDLKPANIMLGKYGETLVVDWGLARAQGRSAEESTGDATGVLALSRSGSAVTEAGSTVGTPAYMSPEQAAGRLDELSPAADVYSLGATLYCLLTGQNPFATLTAREILARVQRGDFLRPRAINAQIPKPLEAICLQAMALVPGDRYASAAALAADVERWLADDSVAAFREPWFERARRWGRRHRALVQTGALAIVLVAAVSLAAAVLINRARHRELLAKTQSQGLYRVAQGYLDRWLPGISEALRYTPGGAILRENLLKSAELEYEQLAQFPLSEASLELERGRALLRLGEARRELGKTREADQAFAAAELHFQQLSGRDPQLADAARVEHGRALNRRGAVLQSADDPRALDAWRSTIRLLTAPAREAESEANRRLVLASARISVCEWLLEQGQFAPAKKEVQDALHLLSAENPPEALNSQARSAQQDRARLTSLRLLARINNAQGNPTTARDLLLEAARVGDQLAHSSFTGPAELLTVGEIQIELAGVLRSLGWLEQELAAYAAAIPGYRQLVSFAPDSLDYQELLAITLIDRAQVSLELSRLANAEVDLAEATRIVTQLTTKQPQIAPYQQELATVLEANGRLKHAQGEFLPAQVALQQACDLLQGLAAARPDAVEYREREAVARIQLGRTLNALGKNAATDTQFASAAGLLEELRMLAPDYPALAVEQAWLHTYWAGCLGDRGTSAQAAQQIQQAIECWTAVAERWPTASSLCAFADVLTGQLGWEASHRETALRHAHTAVASAPAEQLPIAVQALALYRAERYDEALDVLNRADTSTPLARHAFTRALALNAKNDISGALHSFDFGTSLLRLNPGNDAARRLAQEAADVLGLPDPLP